MDVTLLLKAIPTMSEDELHAALEVEKAGAARLYIMKRIYGRFSVLRSQREQQEIAAAMLGK